LQISIAGLFPVDTSPYIKAVWAYLTANFGGMLFLTSMKFIENVDSAPLLLDA